RNMLAWCDMISVNISHFVGFTFYFRSHVTEMFFNVLFKITSVCHTKGWVDITCSKHLRFLLWIRCPYWIDKETLQTTRFNTLFEVIGDKDFYRNNRKISHRMPSRYCTKYMLSFYFFRYKCPFFNSTPVILFSMFIVDTV